MKPAALPQRIDPGAWRDGAAAREDGQAILDALPVGALVVETAASGVICRAANLAYEDWAGIARHTALGLRIARLPIVAAPPLLAALAAGAPHADWYDRNGHHFIAHLSPVAGAERRTLVILRDRDRESIAGPAYDALTGLPDRLAFANWVKSALAARAAGCGEVAVLALDLDRLTAVNESLGYAMGDLLLCAVAARLQACIADGNLLARIAGDRFAILATGLEGTDCALALAQKATAALMPPFPIEGCDIFISAGVGVATTAARDGTSDQLIRDAELAMHRAKRGEAGRIALYQPLSQEVARDRFLLESDLRRACERGQLFLTYQPIVDLDTGAIAGFEALARWQHPERGVVSPVDFIPLAEASGVIVQIGRWALETACAQLADWRARLGPAAEQLMMSVNLSGIQLARDDVVGAVMAVLKSSKLPPDRLKLELTESVIVENPERAGLILERLKSLGVAIAMDDFGTGFSSLGALQGLPIDALKVDRSFVMGMTRSRDSYKIVDAILSLARSLGLSAVAEGVETAEQAEMLAGLGCQLGQGYLFARPLSKDDAEAYLLANTAA